MAKIQYRLNLTPYDLLGKIQMRWDRRLEYCLNCPFVQLSVRVSRIGRIKISLDSAALELFHDLTLDLESAHPDT